MNMIRPSSELIKDLTNAEIHYMVDRMTAIKERPGNPEGVEVEQFGQALCLYSRSMPWPSFNTVKGLTSTDTGVLDQICEFYACRDRRAQFEIVPSYVDQNLLQQLADRGFYQSGFHTTLYTELSGRVFDEHELGSSIQVTELTDDQFDTYATIHCRGTGLPDSGIAPVAANNRVLVDRPGWRFYLATVDGKPAAVGVMHIQDDLASLTFAATLPEYRSLGLQQALLRQRIEDAKRHGCRLVIGQCAYLSQSHRNMERVGMRIGYTRATWTSR